MRGLDAAEGWGNGLGLGGAEKGGADEVPSAAAAASSGAILRAPNGKETLTVDAPPPGCSGQ